jgi:hypothetical protein
MVDSALVLKGQAIAYTLYVLAILALMAWFAWRVTRPGKSSLHSGWFYAFVGLLVVAGVTLHIATYRTILWKELDMNRASIKADKVFNINVAAHRFQLPLRGLFSVELAQLIADQGAALYGPNAPSWLASLTEAKSYWGPRDGSLTFAEVHQRHPQLLVLVVASAVDHVQGQPDHPHVRGQLEGWLGAGQPFVRLNPDRAYLAAICDAEPSSLPDNDAGSNAPYPGIEPWLEPEANPELPAMDAAVAELADRHQQQELAANLDAVLPVAEP